MAHKLILAYVKNLLSKSSTWDGLTYLNSVRTKSTISGAGAGGGELMCQLLYQFTTFHQLAM